VADPVAGCSDAHRRDFLIPRHRRQAPRRMQRLLDGLAIDRARRVVVTMPWVRVEPREWDPGRRLRGRSWALKLYLGVPADHYWTALDRLASLTGPALRVPWKFVHAAAITDRPDRIVLYPVDERSATAVAHALSRALRGIPAYRIPLSAWWGRSRKVQFGADPVFLPAVSWREHCAAAREAAAARAADPAHVNVAASFAGPLAWDERLSPSRRTALERATRRFHAERKVHA